MTHSAGNQPMAWPVHCTMLPDACAQPITWAVVIVLSLHNNYCFYYFLKNCRLTFHLAEIH